MARCRVCNHRNKNTSKKNNMQKYTISYVLWRLPFARYKNRMPVSDKYPLIEFPRPKYKFGISLSLNIKYNLASGQFSL